MIERDKPSGKDIFFSFHTKPEGRKALKMAIDLVAGKCGVFLIVPQTEDDPHGIRGYIGFTIRGKNNALSGLTLPEIQKLISRNLNISRKQLMDIIDPYLRRSEGLKSLIGQLPPSHHSTPS